MNEDRFRLAAQVAGLAVAEIDYATDQVHLSPEAVALLGLPPQTSVVSRATIHALFHPHDRPALEKLILASHDPTGSGEFAMDHRIVRPDGQVRWHSVRKQVYFEQARPARSLLVMFDITERKRAEDALQENAALFSTLIAQAPMGTYVVNAQFRMQQVNAEAMPVFASVQPLIGRDFQEVMEILWGREVGNQCADIFRHTLATGERYISPPFTEQRHDLGIEQTYEWETQRLTLPDGQHGVVCYFHEVTERARATEALRASQARMRLAAEATGVGIWEWNLVTNAIRWDQLMFRIYGIEPTPDGFVNYQDWSGAVLPEDLAENEAILQDTVRRCGRSERTFRIRRCDDGERRHITAVETVRTNAQGKAEWVVGTNLDITARKEAEVRLQESEQRFRLAADAAPVLIWLSGTDKMCYWFNEPWLAFTGRSMDQEVGHGWAEGVHPDDKDCCLETYISAFDARTPFSMEYRLRRHDGEYRWLIDQGVPRFGENDEFEGYIGSCLDVTDYKNAEADLKDADRRKDEFLATLAHELRNPLAPISSGLEIIRMAKFVPEGVLETSSIMERQLKHLVRLVDDLMDVNRINNGKMVLQKEYVSLASVVDSAVETSHPMIDQMGHVLTVNLPKQSVLLEVDLTRLAQVFSNLLNNAAKYTKRGGQISLTAERRGSDLVVSVKDNGIGIAEDQLPRVFELFSQVNGSLERSQGGLGIGLMLVRRLVEMHAGSIEARSDGPGKGAEFVVHLPVVVEAMFPLVSEKVDRTGSKSTLRILIVDDSPDIAYTLSKMLDIDGHSTRAVYSGEEAIGALSEFRPDVILLDIGLPGMTGYEACRRIRELPGGRDFKIIAQSGWGSTDDRRQSQEAGFDHHLVKPFDMQTLMKLLQDSEKRIARD